MANRGGPAQRPNASAPPVYQFKLVLLGESAVGKSSLVLRFVKGQFFEHQESTIGAAFLTQTVDVDDRTIKFEIWDTAGQERYHSLAPMYYRGAQAAVVVYDITNMDTFGRAKLWIKELQRQASQNIVVALAGNKADLSSRRAVEYALFPVSRGKRVLPSMSTKKIIDMSALVDILMPDALPVDGENYAHDNGLLFMETSAKTSQNVNELFINLAKKLPTLNETSGGVPRGIDLRNANPQEQSTGGCCK